MGELPKGTRITGADRTRLATQLTAAYASGSSIRDLAADTGRSYGFVHRVLSESGVQLRGRGGAQPAKARPAAAAAPSGRTATSTSRTARAS